MKKYVLLLAFFLILNSGARAGSETLLLKAQNLTLTLQKTSAPEGEGIAICALTDAEGTEYFASRPHPVFRIEFRDPSTKKIDNISSLSGWDRIKIERTAGAESEDLHITLSDPRALSVKPSATVEVLIKGSKTKPEFRMSWTGTSSSKTSFFNGHFPLISFRPFGDHIKGIYPSLSGRVSKDIFNDSFRYSGIYPTGFSATMGWVALWDEAAHKGLYTGFEDPFGSLRYFRWIGKSKEKISTFTAQVPFENMGVPGNSLHSTGEVVFRTFKGDWYDAALIYRDWASQNAHWWPKTLGPEGRSDIPLWMKENCVFLMMSTDPRWLTPNRRTFTPLNKMAETTAAFRKATGVPGAVHWYLWHQNSYDNDYPHFFPAKEGFAEEVLKLQQNGDFRAMPYTNGRLWDTRDRGKEDWKFTKQGLAGATKKEDGSLYTEQYVLPNSGKEADGTPTVHALMCPASKVWQDRVRENVLTAMDGHNVQAVYIDQIGAAHPILCFDKSHGHPVGGGHWWLDQGQWKSLSRIRTDMRKEVPDYPLTSAQKELLKKNPDHLKNRIICTECNAEVYAHVVDGFLTWHWQHENQVPAFCVIYGGIIPMFGRTSTGDALSVKMRVCEALTFGEQIGWFDANIKDDPEKFPFIRDAIRFRWQARSYFYKGRMARPPVFLDPIPTITADWVWGTKPNTTTKSALQCSVWRIPDYQAAQKGKDRTKSAIVIFSNVSDQAITARVDIHAAELGFTKENCSMQKITSEGKEPARLSLELLNQKIVFPAGTSWGYEISY
ncbi:MAG: DUF6259 domain-containing protein [Planctomycetia bacterium]|nr:DUF6259 domain-containing protein [Planctomycetia bacterium]